MFSLENILLPKHWKVQKNIFSRYIFHNTNRLYDIGFGSVINAQIDYGKMIYNILSLLIASDSDLSHASHSLR